MAHTYSDEELEVWINKLAPNEMREVLQYMLLLNADAVQRAMQYVQRKKSTAAASQSSSSSDTDHNLVKAANSEDYEADTEERRLQQQQQQSPIKLSRSSDDGDEELLENPRSSHSSTTSTASGSQRGRASVGGGSGAPPPPPASRPKPEDVPPSPQPTRSLKPKIPKKKTVIVLCTMKPSSKKQAEDQDRAMALCKANSILPFIVLRENKMEYTQQLLAISHQSMYPQFFIRIEYNGQTAASDEEIQFWGDYDTLQQLHIQGQVQAKLSLQPDESASAKTASSKRLDAMFHASSQLRMSTGRSPMVDIADNDDDDTLSSGETNEDSVRSASRRQERKLAAAYAHLQGTKNATQNNKYGHLETAHQPKVSHDSDNDSLGEDEVFDKRSNNNGGGGGGILQAAKRARAKMDAEIAAKSPHGYLEKYNQPKVDHDSDNDSLGEEDVFDDKPSSSSAQKGGLLAAAKRARAQMDAANGTSSSSNNNTNHLENMNQPIEEHESDNDSLGDDVAMLFEPPKPPPPSQPLLSAAKKAAAARAATTIIEEGDEEEEDEENEEGGTPSPPEEPTPRSSNHHGLKSASTTQPNNSKTEEPTPASPFGETIKLRSVSSPLKSPNSGKNLPPTPLNSQEAASSDGNVPAWMQILKEQEEGGTNDTTNTSPSSSSSNTPSWMDNAAAQGQPTTTTTTKSEPPASRGVKREKSMEKKLPDGGACYLVYDAVQGELNIHYSEVPIIGAVGVWTSPDILAFKHAQGLSRSELIGNCASHVQDRKNYYNGWCQFIKAAKSMDATVMCLDVGVPVDFYVHVDGTTTKAADGTFETEFVDAVACVPKNHEFDLSLKGKKWSKAAKKIGAVALFKVLSSKDGPNVAVSSTPATGGVAEAMQPNPSKTTVPPPIPEEENAVEENVKMNSTAEGVPPEALTAKEAVPAPQPVPVAEPTPPPPQLVEESGPPEPTPPVAELPSGEGYASAAHAPAPDGGACYLVYEPDSSGRLVEHYSKTPIADAIGRWTPTPPKKIAGFKFKQNLGKTVLIGSCSAGVQGRKNYASGWCQYVRSAKVMKGEVMLWDPVGKGLMVDVYLYTTDKTPANQTVKLLPGVATSTDNVLAVACIPKKTPFYAGMAVDILKWLADGSTYGASSKFQ